MKDLGWDVEWEEDMAKEVGKWLEKVDLLGHIRIPRWEGAETEDVELHVFTDASQDAFGGIAFLRSIHPERDIKVQLVMARSRIAPVTMKKIPGQKTKEMIKTTIPLWSSWVAG